MKSDYKWLHEWDLILKDKDILELGCGDGKDSQVLFELGKKLVACDINLDKFNDFTTERHNFKKLEVDHSEVLPFAEGEFDVVVASLCLHYFTWEKTSQILKEISRVLKPKGILLCRVNSSQDINYGSQGYPEIEQGLYSVKGFPKRFFEKTEILNIFNSEWKVSNLMHKEIDRYKISKFVWQFSAVHT
jgi:SAM-dependent methyltransferase